MGAPNQGGASCALSLNEDGTLGYPRYILTSFATLHVTSNSKGLFHLAGGSAETSTTMDEFPRTTTPRKGGTVVCARHSKGKARLRIEGCRAMLPRLSARPGVSGQSGGPSRPSPFSADRTISDHPFGGQQTLEAGYLLGQRYEIISLLGEGGMGAVYKARDIELNRTVALKTIRREYAANPAIIDRFKQELILSTQVTHRNVVRIYDLGEAEGIKFITMEYVEGEDLRPSSIERKNFPPTRRSRSSSRCAGRLKRRTLSASSTAI